MKYKLFPLIMYCWALIFSLMMVFIVMDVKTIPDGVIIIVIISSIIVWGMAIDSNQDSNNKELRDILNERLPEKEKIDNG